MRAEPGDGARFAALHVGGTAELVGPPADKEMRFVVRDDYEPLLLEAVVVRVRGELDLPRRMSPFVRPDRLETQPLQTPPQTCTRTRRWLCPCVHPSASARDRAPRCSQPGAPLISSIDH